MRHCLDGHDPLRLRFLSLIKALNVRIIPHREIGRFDKRPGQILVAILGIALGFACAIAELGAIHATTIGGPLAHGGKAMHVPGFEHDGQGQGRAQGDACLDRMLDGGNLFGHTAHHREGARASQGEVRGGQHVAHRLCRQGFDAIAGEGCAGVAGHEIVNAQEMTRLLSHQLTVFSQ